jgi:hypothetical protein
LKFSDREAGFASPLIGLTPSSDKIPDRRRQQQGPLEHRYQASG